jgi:hypothetical protein
VCPRPPSRVFVDQVRTALINLVAEITAHMPEGVDTPSPEVATNAVNFLVTGEHHKISFSAPQAGTALAAPQPEEHPGAGCELLQPSSSASPRSLECLSHSWKHKAGVSNLADQAESGTVRRRRTASQGAVLFHPSLR